MHVDALSYALILIILIVELFMSLKYERITIYLEYICAKIICNVIINSKIKVGFYMLYLAGFTLFFAISCNV
jgi:hypothetical protein